MTLVLALAACAQGTAVQTSQTTQTTQPVGGANPSPEATATPADVGAAELSLRQEDRARAGLENLGSGSGDLAALMDERGSAVLSEGKQALLSDVQQPASHTPLVILADLPNPGSTIIGPWLIATQAFDTVMPIGVSNTRKLDDSNFENVSSGENAASGTVTESRHHGVNCAASELKGCEGPDADFVTVAGNPGTIFTTTTLTAAYAGSTLSADVTITTYGEVHDVATGAVIYRIESTGTAHIDGDACPDASGATHVHVTFAAKENYFIGADPNGGRAGYGLEQSYTADVRIQADDNANLAGIEITAQAHEESKGGVRAAGAAQSDLFANKLDATGTQTFDYNPQSGFTRTTTPGDAPTTIDSIRLAGGMALYTELPAQSAAKAVEAAWRSGMCVRVSANPKGGDVGKDFVTQVTVTVRQRYDSSELHKPVEASFSGIKSLQPAGGKQDSPANYQYTAGSNDGDSGGMNFKSTSNRGIGQTSAHFVVHQQTMHIHLEMTYLLGLDVTVLSGKRGGTDTFDGTLNLQQDGTWKGVVTGTSAATSSYTFGKTCTTSWDGTQQLELTGTSCHHLGERELHPLVRAVDRTRIHEDAGLR